MKEETTAEALNRINREGKRESELEEFNKGPTNGTLNDKQRMALIYKLLLEIRDQEHI